MRRLSYIILVSTVLFLINACEKEVFVESKSDLAVNTNKVYIDSYPQGAIIYLDGKNTGQITPDTLRWLSDGAQVLSLKKQYFLDTSFTIKTEAGIPKNVLIDYTKARNMLGTLTFTSQPSGAKIFVDNVYTGYKTPANMTNMIPKQYSIKYTYPEYRADSVKIVVESNKISSSTLVLDDTLDIIVYNTLNSRIPTNMIIAATEDKNGNMWFGTDMYGLLKLDGKKFDSYRSGKDNFVITDYVRRLRTDKEKNIWVGYSNGIAKYDGVNWSLYPSKMINSLQISLNNEMIASSERGGLYKYYAGQMNNYTTSNSGISSNDIISACIDKNGYFWAGIIYHGIDVFDGSKWIHLDSAKNRLPYNQNIALEVDNDGTLYGVFYKNIEVYPAPPTVKQIVAKYSSGKWINLFSGMAEVNNHEFHVDKNNNIWIGLKALDIYRIYSNNTVVPISQTIHSNLRKFKNPYDRVTYSAGEKVYVDSKGNLWIFGAPIGIIKVKSGRWD